MMTLDELDAQVRAAIQREPRFTHALAYGSRTQRPSPGGPARADVFSDLEYYAYMPPGVSVEPRSWLETVTPLFLYCVNPFGTPNAVTPELHRIELHLVDHSQLPAVLDWPNTDADPAAMLVKDSDGALQRLLEQFARNRRFDPGTPQEVLDSLLNWLTFGSAVLRRGERLRALDLLTWVQADLIRLCRFAEHTEQPRAATRLAEEQLPPARLDRLNGCTAGVGELERAYLAALTFSAELTEELHLERREALLAALRTRLGHGL